MNRIIYFENKKINANIFYSLKKYIDLKYYVFDNILDVFRDLKKSNIRKKW